MIVNTNDFAVNFLPSKKRLDIYKAWVKTLCYPLQVLYNTMFGTFKDGNSASDWSNVATYAIGDQVKYVDKSIYQCYVATTAGIAPTDSGYWFKVQDKFVGIEPRLKYNAQRLVFEWALNEWFGTTFVNTPGASDIYIDDNAANEDAFFVGTIEAYSSSAVYDDAEAVDFVGESNPNLSSIEFSIFVPVAVWTALGSTNENRNNTVRQIADLYVYAGINYDIQTY